MGDVLSLAVMIGPMLESLPKARIVVWCHGKNAHVYANDARVWKVVTAPFPWSNRGSKRGTAKDWRAVWRSCREVRALRPDVAIDTRGDVRSQMAMYLAGCGCRVGYTTYVGSNLKLRGLLLTHPLADPPEMHRYLTNLRALQSLLGTVPALKLPALIRPEGLQTKGDSARTVLVHPGGGWIYKRWLQERWVALIERLQAMDGIQVLVVAGPGEVPLAEEICQALKTPLTVHATSYEELVRLIAEASLFVGLDSGPMNIATLLNVPAVALFGPGDSDVWRPLSECSRFFHYVKAYPCHPCTQRECVRPEDSCMTTIGVDEVFAAARDVLAGDILRILR
jgi:ADP-heptose:LPS heptosyltransferase